MDDHVFAFGIGLFKLRLAATLVFYGGSVNLGVFGSFAYLDNHPTIQIGAALLLCSLDIRLIYCAHD